jgi:histidine triad (HIT) family protein
VPCPFCAIVSGQARAHVVLEEDEVMGFLDARPVFPGHVLVVPRTHHETLADLPAGLVGVLFEAARRVALAHETALEADGAFVAVNNRVSQSVPHVHVHVVPRRRKDGLRGFFWPRQRYQGDDQMAAVAGALRDALSSSSSTGSASPTGASRSAPE